jgi:capsular polysaccharide export protein
LILSYNFFQDGFLEKFGVNGYSKIPRNPDFYLNRPEVELLPATPVRHPFWYMSCWAILYYFASVLLTPIFRHYKHHRPLTLREAWPWLRGAWRKYYFAYKEKGIQLELTSTLSGKFFLVALQVHNDAQIHVHSNFKSVEAFIESTISSFAEFAPEDTYLIIKHHPLDRGYHDYSSLIHTLTEKYAVVQRVRYIHDQHLPTLLSHARGIILVNSTVGLSALHHRKPLMVCGTALYDMPGLSYQGPLSNFWHEAKNYSINDALYRQFKNYLIEHTQLNGNFYRRLKIPHSHTGLFNIAELKKQTDISFL